MARAIVWTVLILAAAALNSSCGAVHDEPIVGQYRLSAIDVDEDMSIYYSLKDGGGVGRIGATVFAVGFNPEYVVAARHPKGNRSLTEYFYIVRGLDAPLADPTVAVRGPFELAVFQAESTKLGLPALSRIITALK